MAAFGYLSVQDAVGGRCVASRMPGARGGDRRCALVGTGLGLCSVVRGAGDRLAAGGVGVGGIAATGPELERH